MEILSLVQWPAMVATIVAAWLIGSLSKRKRTVGFWLFLFSNLLWIAWGAHDGAYALIVLQLALAALNIRGVAKNENAERTDPDARSAAPGFQPRENREHKPH